ncbi:TPA: hypothetical protein J8W40_004086 [Citrobacter koseri]|nr:hypothetical protein [Citrobacter koseri]
MTMYQDLPSVLNLINCESPFPCNQASCAQGIADKNSFVEFIVTHKSAGHLHEWNLSYVDRFNRLIKVFYHDHMILHARINMKTGIVNLIAYTVFTDKISSLEAEYLVEQIRQHLDHF